MIITSYNDVNALLNILLTRIKTILYNKLIGLYLYGSLVSGDFDHKISDIDLLAVTNGDIDDLEFAALKKMHDNFSREYKEWNDRIEVQYISVSGLKTFKTQLSKIANISPGEPLHIIEAGRDWLINWYDVQEKRLTLFGLNKASIITKISKDEYINTVKEHVVYWRELIKKYNSQSTRGSVAFVILTLCVEMYSCSKRERVSKTKAASWVVKQFPQWASLIHNVIAWREAQWNKEQKRIGTVLPKVIQFVNFAIDQIVK